MTIYTYWEPGQAELFRLWDRSWRARGWETKICSLLIRPKFSYPHKLLKHKGSWISSLRIINFGLRPGNRLNVPAVYFNKPGWETADLVVFDSEAQVLGCGRKI